MRPAAQARYTIIGKYGSYVVPNLAAVDARLRTLTRLQRDASPAAAARIRHDIDLLLEWRTELMQERGATT